ncbi:MAG: ribonuclease HI [Gemmatimonadaceae bacterium]|nr:ribonuclease HI [Gemmatimonadaceae bacterium]
MSARYPLVAVYADESCLGNGKAGATPGGAGGLVEYQLRNGDLVFRDFWISEPDTTNNRMALQSVIQAFTHLSAKGERLSVVFTTDSRYLVDGMTSWVHGWSRKQWRKADGKPVENLALWHAALQSVTAGGHEVEWRWVKGHAGHVQNEWANHLATTAAANQTLSDGLVDSGFSAWMETNPLAVRRSGPPALFPTASAFVPARPLPVT